MEEFPQHRYLEITCVAAKRNLISSGNKSKHFEVRQECGQLSGDGGAKLALPGKSNDQEMNCGCWPLPGTLAQRSEQIRETNAKRQ